MDGIGISSVELGLKRGGFKTELILYSVSLRGNPARLATLWGQDDGSMLYPGGITEISRGLSEATPPDSEAKERLFFIPEG